MSNWPKLTKLSVTAIGISTFTYMCGNWSNNSIILGLQLSNKKWTKNIKYVY